MSPERRRGIRKIKSAMAIGIGMIATDGFFMAQEIGHNIDLSFTENYLLNVVGFSGVGLTIAGAVLLKEARQAVAGTNEIIENQSSQ